MKVRVGFVSNSSSTSFCIYGTTFSDMSEVIELITEIGSDEMIAKQAKSLLADGDDDLSELLENWAAKEKLYFTRGPSGDGVYIGREWTTIKDDETGGQFKKGVEEKLKTIFGKVACHSHEESWTDN